MCGVRWLVIMVLVWGWAGAVAVAPWPLAQAPASWRGADGPYRVAWVTAEVSGPALRAQLAALARQAFGADPGLAQVDLSLFAHGTAHDLSGRFGAEPLATASLRREDQRWLKGDLQGFGRMWLNAAPPPPGFAITPRPVPVWDRGLSWALGGPRGGSLGRMGPRSGGLALTLDDAPHPLFTALWIHALRREGTQATFFMIGRLARAYPFLARDLVQAGHEAANHTYSHGRLPELSAGRVAWEISAAQQAIAAATGVTPRWFRAPGGQTDDEVRTLAWGAGLISAGWTNDPADYQNLGTGELLRRLRKRYDSGGIVLLHDNVPQSLEVFGQLMREARARGLRVGTLGQLAWVR